MAQTEPQFKPGDRFFTHYDMKWGTVVSENTTYRNQTHGVTGSKLPDTTWYNVKYDDGSTSLLDDAHGNWDMARMSRPTSPSVSATATTRKASDMFTVEKHSAEGIAIGKLDKLTVSEALVCLSPMTGSFWFMVTEDNNGLQVEGTP
jgi:hypothetical protein